MKILKFIAIGLALFFALALLGAFFLPRHIVLEREAQIQAPDSLVFAQVDELRNWERWSWWITSDSTMRVQYGQPSAGKGGSYSWTSRQSGDGRLSIVESQAPRHLRIDIHFGPEGSESGGGTDLWDFEPANGGTAVRWRFESDMGANPLMRYVGTLFIKPAVGQSMDEGLAALRRVCEG